MKVLSPVHFNPNAGTHPKHGGSGSSGGGYSPWAPSYDTWGYRFPVTLGSTGIVETDKGFPFLVPVYARIDSNYSSNACATNTFVLKNDNVSVTNRQYGPVFVFETGQRPPLVTFGESEAHA